MKLISCTVAALAALFASLGAAAHTDLPAGQYTAILRAASAPTIDGKLDDAAWRSAVTLPNFVSISEKIPLTQQTKVRLLWDSKYLYLGLRCSEADLRGLVHYTKLHDGNVWVDDCVEVLLDTANAHRICYHVMANCMGVTADEKNLEEGRSDMSWDSGCLVKSGRTSGAWTLEMAIPFSSMGIVPSVGLTCGMNVCRERAAGVKEYSSWWPTAGGFVQPAKFGHIVLGDAKSQLGSVQLLTWGNLSSDKSSGGANALQMLISNRTARPAKFDVRLNGRGKGIAPAQQDIQVGPGETTKLTLPYTVAAASSGTYLLSVSENGRQILKATHPCLNVPPTARVWNVKDPLFSQLLSQTPPGEQKNGTIYWFHNGISTSLLPFAKEFGVRYSVEEQYKELADRRFMPIIQKSNFSGFNIDQMADRYGFKVLYQPDYRSSRTDGVPVIDGMPYVFDPRSKAAYFKDLEWALQNERKYIYAVYTQDEMHEKALKQGVLFFDKMRDSYPYIREVDGQVKSQFGFGKYGLPTSSTDDNPYRWIAYHKWVNKQMLDWQRDTFEMTRRLAPEIKVISFDPVAGHNPFALDAYGPIVDIATHQLYPSRNPNRQEFGFVTKFVVDLVGKPTWPCAHVENYAYSTTPEETRELMSQVMRNGGKGFHLYIPDVIGNGANEGDTLLTKIGCPERYRAICEILDTTYSMNEVAMPTDPDSAILYSEDNYQAFPARDQVYPNEPEYAYTFLGPVARTWFKFVNDNMVADGRANLSAMKAVVVPSAKYERATVVAAMTDYVKAGGTLVCGDPEAFTYGVDGKSLASVREKLLGVTCASGPRMTSLTFSKACSLKSLRGRKLSVYGPTFAVTPAAGVEVMAKFSNGSPAVVRHKLGRGSVIFFAFNPFTEHAIGQPEWKSAFKNISSDLGLKTGRDIWRFRFPAFKTVYQPDVTGTCLTGNYVKWHQEKPLDVANATIGGKYSYSIAPDAIPDRGEPAGVAFGQGKLTDRKRAPSVSKSSLDPRDFVVSWKTPQPVDVTLDFGGPHAVNSVHLWYTDQLPSFSVDGSADGRNWIHLASYPAQQVTKDVLDLSLSWKPQSDVRYVRLSFGVRDPAQAMTLVEAEVWSEK